MNKLTKQLGIAVFAVFAIFATITSAIAVGDTKYAEMTYNTDKCAPNSCQTHYTLKFVENGTLDWTTFYVRFRDTASGVTKTPEEVTALKSFDVLRNQTVTTEYVCDDGTKTNKTKTCTKNENSWVSFKELGAGWDYTAGTSIRIIVTGNLDRNKGADNVIHFLTSEGLQTYDQWAYWNATDTGVWYQMNTTIALDSTGNGNLLAIASGAPFTNTTWTVSGGNGSWQSDGADYSRNVTPTGVPLGTVNMSLGCFFNIPALPDADTVNTIFSFGKIGATNDQQMIFGLHQDAGVHKIRWGSRADLAEVTKTVNVSVTNQIVVTYNNISKARKLYFNGEYVAESVSTNPQNWCGGISDGTCGIYVGDNVWDASGGYRFKAGEIADCRIYNHELNTSQVTNWWNGTKGWGSLNLDQAPTLPPEMGPASFTQSAARGNLTVREASVQTWNLTVLYNTSAMGDINATFYYGSLTPYANEGSFVWNATHNAFVFNATFAVPLTQTNGSSINWNWTYVVGFANGTRTTHNVTTNTTSVLWSYFWNTLPATNEASVYETNSTIVRHNLTKLETGATLRANQSWNSVTLNLTLQQNSTAWELFNFTRNVSVQATNASTIYYNSTVSVSFNGTAFARNSSMHNHTALFAYFITNLSLTTANLIEGQTAAFNATTLALAHAGIAINFTWNNTNYAGTQLANDTSNNVLTFGTSTASSFLEQNNRTTSQNATLLITFEGITTSRASTVTQPTQTLWKMILTDCTAGSASTTVTERFDIYREENTSQRVATNSEDLHIVYAVAGTNRTYGFSHTSLNNWTICMYPYFAGATLTDDITTQAGDGVTYSIRTSDFLQSINSTVTNISLYVINLTGLNVQQVTVTVQDSNTIPLQGLPVEVYRYSLSTDSYTKVYEATTDSAGILKTYLRTNDQYYRFIVYNSAKTIVLKTQTQIIFGTTVTITIGAEFLKGWDLYAGLLSCRKDPVMYDNITNKFNFTYDCTGARAGNYTIGQVCLRTEYSNPNVTIGNYTESSNVCSASMGPNTLTTAAISSAVADDWRAIAYANITASPASQYGMGIGYYSFVAGLGLEGFFWAIMVSLSAVGASLWNPPVAIASGVLILAFMSVIGIIPAWGAALATTVIAFGGVAIWYSKS